jgi:hypothetical protein
MRSNASQALAADVDALAGIAVESLPLTGLQELIATLAPQAARLAGIVSRAVGELEVRSGGQVPAGASGLVAPTAAWLREAAHVSGRRAGQQVRTAVALRELPQVRDTIVDGQLTPEHGRVLARLVGRIEPAALLAAQPDLIEVARRCDPDSLAVYVRHLLASWCEPLFDDDERTAEQRRYLQLVNRHNGSWRGRFELPDAAIEIVLAALEPLARRDDLTDQRTAGQRRADALVDCFDLILRHAPLPDAGGERPRLSYIVPADWHLGPPQVAGRPLLDLDRPAPCPSAPWTGPATRAQIEQLLCDARLELLTLTENGTIVSLTTATDRITATQRRAVTARDRCCTARGCHRPPAFCDVHHLRARADGGPTDIANLVLLCRRHHSQWHRAELGLQDLRAPWLRVPAPAGASP